MLLFRMLLIGTVMIIHGLQVRGQNTKLIAFYNVENLFDTLTAPNEAAFDKPGWDSKRYRTKISNLARAIAQMGRDHDKPAPDLLGLAEVENSRVIRHLIEDPHLIPAGYEFAHVDSPDHRGIDVALLFRREAFIPHHIKTHDLRIYTPKGQRIHTRDVLVVSGYLEDEMIYLLVNHWPSRRGGKQSSSGYRDAAARLNRKIIDSLRHIDPDPYVIVMGDFNDDPGDPSIYHTLYGREQPDSLKRNLFNPMLKLYKQGFGSLAYRDRWHLFDQILLSGKVLANQGRPFHFKQAGIYMPSWLKTTRGAYKGYPLRTYAGTTYTAGFSDHFPVFVLFERAAENNSLVEPEVVRDPGEN